MIRRHLPWLVLIVLLVIASACSSRNPQPQAAPPTATGGAQSAPPTSTLAPAVTANAPAQPAPTDTALAAEPPQAAETSAPTATLTRTPRPRGTVATARPRNTAAPLNVTYEVVEIKRISDIQATLVMKVIATGGSGGYRYYHDDVQQANATFNIAGTCGKPFVHTIKVTAGDGQTVLLPYHVNGVCPTPTP
jgi:hypothetical protein